MIEAHLLTPEEIGKYSRPISQHIDEKVLLAYIDEAEELDIRPVLGNAFFFDVATKQDNKKYKVLLEGGSIHKTFDNTFDYTFSIGGNDDYCVGLKRCLAYYVLARIVKNNDLQITRGGLVRKDLDYSEKPNSSEKRNQYGEICDLADRYKVEVLNYLNRNKLLFPCYAVSSCKGKKVVNNRSRYKLLGD